ncbi:MAG: hypothetical protein LH605_00060 [Microbacteriaceae bacterium]|nr:hypothetical protein [Microbacteriaceae bacterium]
MSDPRDDGPVDPNRPPDSTTPPPVPPAPEDGGYSQPASGSVPYGSQSSQPTGSSQPSGYAQAGGYGQPAGYAQPTYGASAPSKTLSLIGMIAGIVGLLGSGIAIVPIIGSILGLFIPAAAIVLGFLGKNREGALARPFWLTALITGFIGVAIALVALVIWIILFSVGSGTDFTGLDS